MSTFALTPSAPARPAFLDQRQVGVVSRTAAPRLRMTERGRAVLLTVLATPIAVALAAGILSGGTAEATMDDVTALEFVTVLPGQSLWGLAAEVAPDADPRDVIVDLMRFNRLSSADVMAGQQIAVPPKYAD